MVDQLEAFKIAFSQYLRCLDIAKIREEATELYLCLQSSRRSEQDLIRKLNESRRVNTLLARKNNELHYINESLSDEIKGLQATVNVLQWQKRQLGYRIYGNTYATTRIPPDESRLA